MDPSRNALSLVKGRHRAALVLCLRLVFALFVSSMHAFARAHHPKTHRMTMRSKITGNDAHMHASKGQNGESAGAACVAKMATRARTRCHPPPKRTTHVTAIVAQLAHQQRCATVWSGATALYERNECPQAYDRART